MTADQGRARVAGALTVVMAVTVVFGFVAGPVAAVVAGVAAFTFFLVQWVIVPRRLGSQLAGAAARERERRKRT